VIENFKDEIMLKITRTVASSDVSIVNKDDSKVFATAKIADATANGIKLAFNAGIPRFEVGNAATLIFQLNGNYWHIFSCFWKLSVTFSICRSRFQFVFIRTRYFNEAT